MNSPKLFGVLGHHISYSLSPFIFNSVFRTRGLNYLYASFDVGRDDLRNFINSAKMLQISGFNVTIPHKEHVIRYLDDLDNLAELVGAVNLVVNRKGKLVGYDTDLYGIKATVENHLKFPIGNRRVLLIGAGGAAGAAIEYLRKAKPASVILANRTIRRAKKLRDISQMANAEIVSLVKLTRSIEDLGIDMVINATPVATTAFLKSIPSRLRIFDMSYRPRMFPYGKSRIRCDGRYMLAAQASRGLSILCGVNVPTDKIFKLVKEK